MALRRVIQLSIVALAVTAGLWGPVGSSDCPIERFCPFGGVETVWSLATGGTFTCATGPLNLTLAVALLAVTVLARKSFCGWVCPVGAVSEWLGGCLARLRRARARGLTPEMGLFEPPARVDRPLRWGRAVVLAAVLVATAWTAELVFRPFDPYYVLFSFHGHEVRWWSYPLVAALLVLAAAIPMAWCRYLCPLGGLLWPFSRFGWLRLRRTAEACSSCRQCERACPHGLSVCGTREVLSGECTLCLECVRACGEQRALAVVPARLGPNAPAWSIPLLLGIAATAGLLSAQAIPFASYERTYGHAARATTRTVTFVVDGVRCVDTAKLAAAQLDAVSGTVSLVARAADRRLEIVYDPSVTNPEELRQAIEGPVLEPASGAYLYNVFRVLDPETTPARGR